MSGETKVSWDGRPLDWRNKPTDRFVLRCIKRYLSAPVTLVLRRIPYVRPWMVTVTSALLGVAAGSLLAFGYPWQGGIVAALSQVLDGVDGQLARLTGRSSPTGAFLDSVMDRYADLAMVVGTLFYLLNVPLPYPIASAALFAVGFFALVGSAAVSYTGARANELGIDLGRPTLASKGTRMTVMILCAAAAAVWEPAPVVALVYLAVHTNAAVVWRVFKAANPVG